MTRRPRNNPATAAQMDNADRQLLAPILTDFRQRMEKVRNLCPGGQLNCDDLKGIARATARDHRVTPEDLARWHLAYPEIRA